MIRLQCFLGKTGENASALIAMFVATTLGVALATVLVSQPCWGGMVAAPIPSNTPPSSGARQPPATDPPTSPAPHLSLYVASPSRGNDDWSGTIPVANANRTDGPFASLARARDEIRKRKSAGSLKGPVTVHVRQGLYLLDEPLKLTAADSGTEAAPIVYRAAKGKKAIVCGGRVVSKFGPYKGKILVADVARQGMRGVHFRQLYRLGQRQHLARYPNFDSENPYGGGWAFVDGKSVPMYQEIPGEDKKTLVYKTSDAKKWAKPQDGQVVTFPRYNWWNNIVDIQSIDVKHRKITLANDCSYAIRPGDRYYVQGMLEELDAPSEWYLDRSDWKLYYWPSGDSVASKVKTFVPRHKTILEMTDTQHVTFRGFTFFCCSETAVILRNTKHCLIAGSTIRGVGGYRGAGVAVVGGVDNGIVGNDIFEVGCNAIDISGGEQTTLTSAGNFAENNYLHHVGIDFKQGVGIRLTGCGNRAAHNLIHDTPRFGIYFLGNNHVVEYNHVRHTSVETSDTGAIYSSGRDWIGSRGSIVRYNYFHDSLGYAQVKGEWVSPHFAWGIYLDDNTGGVDVIGNVITRCIRGAIHLHNGRDNLIENNVFVGNKLQQIECSGWTPEHPYWIRFLPQMIRGYDSVRDQDAWKKMRNMGTAPKDAVLDDGTIMAGNRFVRNIMLGTEAGSKYVRYSDLSFEHNEFDSNLVWNSGHPIQTGTVKFGDDVSKNRVKDAGFQSAVLGKMPEGWQMQSRPHPHTTATVVDDGGTQKHALQIPASFNRDKPKLYSIVVSDEQKLPAGKGYRLRARMKATHAGLKARLGLQSFVKDAYFWQESGNEIEIGTQWQDIEFAFKIPGPGDQRYHPQMKLFRIRVGFPGQKGALLVDDIELHKVNVLDAWTAWQSLGPDKKSVVSDPLFVAAKDNNYRLQPGSPALDLGFKPIPLDKIGPYKDALRATWPIVEAEGVREKPLVVESDHP